MGHSDDVLDTWVSRIEGVTLAEGNDSIPERIGNVLAFNEAIAGLFIVDTLWGDTRLRTFASDGSMENAREKLDSVLAQNTAEIDQLVRYKMNGFRKVIALDYSSSEANGNLQCLVFITQDADQAMHVTGFLVDPEKFITELVGPRLQAIARDQFILSTFHKGTPAPFYSKDHCRKAPHK